MAKVEKIIPFLIYFETGVRDAASHESLFEKARQRGIVLDPDDLGGATLVGITAATYSDYCRRTGKKETDLRKLTYAEWLDILKTMFWDRWQADLINSQKVAETLVDWVWTSGKYGITEAQRLLGVAADGIVGPKTLAAVNSSDADILFDALKDARIAYTERICRARPANRKFRSGWLRRIAACGAPSLSKT